MDDLFKTKIFFDLVNVGFAELLTKGENIWDSITLIEEYILSSFSEKKLKPNYGKTGNVYLGEGTVVIDGAAINGPAIIGRNCTIEHGALLRPNCILGDNVHVGHGCELKNAIIMNYSKIAHLNYIGDSIVGSNVNVSGGAIIANYRLDKNTVTIKYNDRKIDTRLEKLGAIIGDGSNIGVNCVLNPGTVLGKNSVVYPLTSVSGYYPEGSVIK